MATIGDLITTVRGILQDRDADLGYRYSEDDLYSILNMALEEVRRIRPDSFFGTVYLPTPQYTSDDADVDFPIHMMFFQIMAYFIAGYCELRDDEYTVDGRASVLLKTFNSQLRSLA